MGAPYALKQSPMATSAYYRQKLFFVYYIRTIIATESINTHLKGLVTMVIMSVKSTLYNVFQDH